MYIQEAVKKVMRTDGVIYRKSVRPEGEANYGAIKPTNSYDRSCCYYNLHYIKSPFFNTRAWQCPVPRL